MNIQETVDMLKRECNKLLDYYIDIIEDPEITNAEVAIQNIENYIDQLPVQYRDSIRETLANYLSSKTAVGMCYAVLGAHNLTSELTVMKMVNIIENGDDIECENELIMDSYQEFMQSLIEYVYYKYTWYNQQYIDTDSLITVIINNMDVILNSKNQYYYDDITNDLDEFVGFIFPENQRSESNYYNMLNPNQVRYIFEMTQRGDARYDAGTKVWESLVGTFRDSISQLFAIEGFCFTEGNRTAVCDFLYNSLMRTYVNVLFGVDINTLDNIGAIDCANKMIFNFPGHIDINNFMEELKLAVRPYIDLFLRLLLKVTYVVNNGFIEYSDGEKIGAILRLKRGFENEIYYNSGNLRKNKVTRYISTTRVQRNYSGAQQYLHASKSQ